MGRVAPLGAGGTRVRGRPNGAVALYESLNDFKLTDDATHFRRADPYGHRVNTRWRSVGAHRVTGRRALKKTLAKRVVDIES